MQGYGATNSSVRKEQRFTCVRIDSFFLRRSSHYRRQLVPLPHSPTCTAAHRGLRMLQGLSSSHRGVVRKYHCTHVSSSRFTYHGKVYESRQSLRLPSSRRFIRRYSTWESSVMWYSLVKVQGVSRMRFPETFEMITLIIRASSSERVFWRRYRRLISAEVSRFCDGSYHSARE